MKDIPDMYIPKSTVTKGILGFLKKKLQGTTGQGWSSKKEATPKARPVCETSHVPRESDLRVQNSPMSGAIQIVVQGYIAIVS